MHCMKSIHIFHKPYPSSSLLTLIPLLTSKRAPNEARLGSQTKRVGRHGSSVRGWVQSSWRWEEAEADDDGSFGRGVELFNSGDYYKCHDVMERLWNTAPEPQRTLLHAILQCSVGLLHLLNQNHRGAMVELGEALSKLQRQRLKTGPFHQFEVEISVLLDFLYNTQLEYAACDESSCVKMDGSDQAYQLLGNFGAGNQLYEICTDDNEFCLQFNSHKLVPTELKHAAALTVKLPVLRATEDDLYKLV